MIYRSLAATDPEIHAALADERRRQNEGLELIASENFTSRAVLEATGSVAHQQVRRGLPRPPLLRRLRGRRPRRDARHRAGEGALRRRARQRPAALRHQREHGGLLRAAAAGRHAARHGPRLRRAPDPRPPALLLGARLQGRRLRRRPRQRADRLRRGRAAGARAPAEAHRLRRLGLQPGDRLRPLPRDRRPRRRAAHGRHRAHRRAGRRRAPPLAGAALPRRHHDHAQDAARSARRHHPLPRRARQGDRSRGLPRPPGRPADARDRRQGGRLRRGRDAGVPRLSGAASSPTPRGSPRRSPAPASGSSRAAPTTTSSWWTSPRGG